MTDHIRRLIRQYVELARVCNHLAIDAKRCGLQQLASQHRLTRGAYMHDARAWHGQLQRNRDFILGFIAE